MAKTILVSGGAGFIGSHVCEKLVKENNYVICLDNFFTGKKSNIEHLLGSPKFELVRHDVTMPFYAEVDEIWNLACPASPVHYQHNPVQTIKTNVMGSVNMLGLAKRTGARILQASTSEVYGDPNISPQPEAYWGNVNPIGPRACYDEGKRCAETLFYDYHRQYGLDIKIVRIFNTYGPNMDTNDGRVVSNFIIQALNNKPITIFGDGSQTRSFCYVDDLVQIMYQVINDDSSDPGPFNIGNPTEFTILELAELVIQMTGSQSELKFFDLPTDDPKQRKPDISKIESNFSWQPKVDLVQGIEKTINYFRHNMESTTLSNNVSTSSRYKSFMNRQNVFVA